MMDINSNEETILDRLLVESLLDRLDEEARFILHHWFWKDLSLEEIGPIFGEKFRGRPLTGGDVRYHKNKALKKLRSILERDQIPKELR